PAVSPTYTFAEPSGKTTIAGNTDIIGEVDIRCYYGNEEESWSIVASKVAVSGGGTFSVEVPSVSLQRYECELRAVEVGASKLGPLPPGTENALEAFNGPIIVPSQFASSANEYSAVSGTLPGGFFIESAGSYALESALFSTAAHKIARSFYGEAALQATPEYGSKIQAPVQIDGASAYAPEAARELELELKIGAIPGLPTITVAKSFNASTRQLAISEEDPLVMCAPSTAYPPTKASCTSFVPTGVTLARTWETSNEDHLARMTDTWRSNNGAAHSVSVHYVNEMFNEYPHPGAYEFPGYPGFTATHPGESRSLPAGAGAILYKTLAGTPDAGDAVHPQDAIVYDRAPNGPLTIPTGTEAEPPSVFELPYQWSVPAGGSSPTLRMAFVQAFTLPEVNAMSAAELASYYPTVAISSPASGTTVSTPTVTVTGTAASAGVTLAGLSVNGAGVAVGAGGAWTASVALRPGANTITATATNQSGLSSAAAISVTYVPPAPRVGPVGSASGAKGVVKFTLACHGVSGQLCHVHASLTTVERLRNGHLIAVVAGTRSKTVTDATRNLVLPAGARVTVTLKLGSTAAKLLRRRGRLPAHLAVTETDEAHRRTVIAQNLVVRPAPRRHARGKR
ncbi:MAG TPA: Ig-like domain-containing protein, partial [Solirubrobacteraceae bacterium]